MTVKDLLEQLSTHSPESLVIVRTGEKVYGSFDGMLLARLVAVRARQRELGDARPCYPEYDVVREGGQEAVLLG